MTIGNRDTPGRGPRRGVWLALALTSILPRRAGAEALVDPPVLASKDRVLQVLVVAREQKLSTLPRQPVGWVYEICRYDPKDGPLRRCPAPGVTPRQATTCPAAADPAVSPYGGIRLQLEPGETLRMRFVNCLPTVAHDRPFPGEFKHVGAGGNTPRLAASGEASRSP